MNAQLMYVQHMYVPHMNGKHMYVQHMYVPHMNGQHMSIQLWNAQELNSHYQMQRISVEEPRCEYILIACHRFIRPFIDLSLDHKVHASNWTHLKE